MEDLRPAALLLELKASRVIDLCQSQFFHKRKSRLLINIEAQVKPVSSEKDNIFF